MWVVVIVAIGKLMPTREDKLMKKIVLLVLLILLNNMQKNDLRTKIMRFANKMSESIIAER